MYMYTYDISTLYIYIYYVSLSLYIYIHTLDSVCSLAAPFFAAADRESYSQTLRWNCCSWKLNETGNSLS